MSGEVELILDAKADLAEGPSWDERSQKLYWVDIEKKQLNIFDPQSRHNRVIQLNQYVGAVVPRQSGGLVLALQHGFYFMDLEKGEQTLVSHPEGHLPSNRFNDGKCDPFGRFWSGTMSMCGEKGAGTLYCLDTDRQVTAVIRGVSVSNGVGWSPDQKTMYYIDSPTKQVVAFDYDVTTGNIRNKRVAVNIPEGEAVPDGMAIDADGNIWVAHWGGYKVSRWDPIRGILLDEIGVPAAHVTSCTFGGENLDELYITTARSGLDNHSLSEQPLAGGLFRFKGNVKGLSTVPYMG